MPYDNLKLEVSESVARITLDRPDAANAINVPMARDLAYAAMDCDEDENVRAIVITGSGKFFCAGGDLASFADAGEGAPKLLKEITTYLHAAISRFARTSAPVIIAVNGTAAGAGFSLACAGDLAIAAESAKFNMAYTGVGLTPDGSSTYYLPKIIGPRRALELMLTNRPLSAAEALDWGIVNQVVADDQVQTAASDLAKRLAAGPTLAYGRAKDLVRAGADLEAQMELETRAIADSARSKDGAAGIEAFLAKTKPEFSGT